MRKEKEEQRETVAVMAAIRHGHIIGVTRIILCSRKLTILVKLQLYKDNFSSINGRTIL